MAVWKRHVGIINSLAFTRDGRRLVTGASWDRLRGAVTIWNARPLPSDAMRPVVPVSFFSLDGKRFVIERDNVKQEARPRVGDTDSEKILCKLEGHYGIGAPGNLGFSPDGRRIVGLVTRIALMNPSGMSGQLIVWDAATGKALLKRKWTKPGLSPPAFSLDGKRIVVRSFGVEKMKPVVKAFVLDSQTGKEVRGEAVPKTVQKRTAGPDGRFLARVAGDNVVLVSSKPDADEIEYRRIQTQPRVWRYRKNYLSARLAAETSSKYRKQYEFAAMFYLNLFAEDDRPALVAEGDALVSAKLPRRGAGQRNRKAIQPIPPGVRIKR